MQFYNFKVKLAIAFAFVDSDAIDTTGIDLSVAIPAAGGSPVSQSTICDGD